MAFWRVRTEDGELVELVKIHKDSNARSESCVDYEDRIVARREYICIVEADSFIHALARSQEKLGELQIGKPCPSCKNIVVDLFHSCP